MEPEYEQALRTLIEGYSKGEVNQEFIVQYLLDKTIHGIRGYRPPVERERGPQEYTLRGWQFFKEFANMLGLVYGQYSSAYEEETNWVATKVLPSELNINQRTFERFKEANEEQFIDGYHSKRINGREILYHKRRVLELYHDSLRESANPKK